MTTIEHASETQRTVILSLLEGWTLRHVEKRGWCLVQPNRSHPFACVKDRTVRALTDAGWLTPGSMPQGEGFHAIKSLTPLGHAVATDLAREEAQREIREHGDAVSSPAHASDALINDLPPARDTYATSEPIRLRLAA